MGDWFHRTIVETNRLPLFCAFVAMLVAFVFIRFSVRMIRAQVKWWPGNVTPGGHHIHHVVFGVVFMCVGGIGALALPDSNLVANCVFGSILGVGIALVLDEFALILHLEDVYWAEAGRTSIDAVFVAFALVGLVLLGFRPLDIGSDNGTGTTAIIGTTIVAVIDFLLVAICLFKGKIWIGLLGICFPLFLIVGAIRVGRPGSPWARWRYVPHKRRGMAKLTRSVKRERRYRKPLIRAKIWFQDLVSGRPDAPEPLPVTSGQAEARPPSREDGQAVGLRAGSGLDGPGHGSADAVAAEHDVDGDRRP
jgi:hypothetical protein